LGRGVDEGSGPQMLYPKKDNDDRAQNQDNFPRELGGGAHALRGAISNRHPAGGKELPLETRPGFQQVRDGSGVASHLPAVSVPPWSIIVLRISPGIRRAARAFVSPVLCTCPACSTRRAHTPPAASANTCGTVP